MDSLTHCTGKFVGQSNGVAWRNGCDFYTSAVIVCCIQCNISIDLRHSTEAET